MSYKLLIAIGGQLMSAGLAFASDTLLVVDKVPFWISHINAAQVDAQTRKLTLYSDRWQWGLAEGPGFKATTALILQKSIPLSPSMRLEWALVAPGDTPRRWHSVRSDLPVVDTMLAPGAGLACWLRMPGQQAAWRWLTAERPRLQPRLTGYLIKDVNDTTELSIRLWSVVMHQGAQLPWHPLSGGLPTLKPGHTLELLVEPLPGMADSSLEYRLMLADEPSLLNRWQATGHLLRLPPLSAGRSYKLDIRYRNNAGIASQQIIVMAHWYQQPFRVAMLVLSTCLLAGLVLYLRYRRRLKASQQSHAALQDQLRRLQGQLNPHFVYNALTSIGGLLGQKQYQEANTYLNEFGLLLRETMNYSKEERLYTLAAEVDMLKHYCLLEQLRFGFRFSIDIDSSLNPEAVMLPPMLAQPLVENAIRHGIQRVREGGEVTIRYIQLNHDFQLIVTDNGPGWQYPSMHQGTGTGLYVTEQRIQYLNALYDSASISFTLQREEPCTVATLHFHNWLD